MIIFEKILNKIKCYWKNKKFLKAWKIKNMNNYTTPGDISSIDKIDSLNRLEIGGKTYGVINFIDSHSSGEMLKIGSYCSIAPGVYFLLGAEHCTSSISTYPFKVCLYGARKEGLSKGDILVGDDVWIGMNSRILSGVCIGKGAVVATSSVVTKDVEPYSIVGGNPARHIRYRFSENLRMKLLETDVVRLFNFFTEEDLDLIYEPLTEDVLNELLSLELRNNGENFGLYKHGENKC
ncbi:MAG: CatB-related O-acetyltransferase [Fibromonadales bacterium]|nr:CatB-related O-acetyltransferase [Fibromonadales bacterium]